MPHLVEDEVFILLLVARKKYGGLSRSEESLYKTIVKKKEHLSQKIHQISLIAGTFRDSKTNNQIPISSLAFYIDLAPKSTLKATNLFITNILKYYRQATIDPNFNRALFKKIDQMLFSAIHKSRSRSPYWVIDVDRKPYDLKWLCEYFGQALCWITETRGGYHLIIEKGPDSGLKMEALKQKNPPELEIFGRETMTIIPGTLQGGFKTTRWLPPNG
ncbi:MAG: hypothetical protein ACTSYB_07605 [Candidatus Helarchaeota archaeon]